MHYPAERVQHGPHKSHHGCTWVLTVLFVCIGRWWRVCVGGCRLAVITKHMHSDA